MTEEEKQKKIKPIYKQLIQILAETPEFTHTYQKFDDSEIWEYYHTIIESLNTISGANYNSFKVDVTDDNWNGEYKQLVNGVLFRQKIAGLISYVGEEYSLGDGDNPSNHVNPVVVNQTQNNTQVVSMIMDFQTIIDENIFSKELKPEEKTFLEKVKKNLPTVKTAAEILALVLKTAKDSGLDISSVAKFFGAN